MISDFEIITAAGLHQGEHVRIEYPYDIRSSCYNYDYRQVILSQINAKNTCVGELQIKYDDLTNERDLHFKNPNIEFTCNTIGLQVGDKVYYSNLKEYYGRSYSDGLSGGFKVLTINEWGHLADIRYASRTNNLKVIHYL